MKKESSDLCYLLPSPCRTRTFLYMWPQRYTVEYATILFHKLTDSHTYF
jgi:hypothetical protein